MNLRFASADFDCYQSSKWKSNLYNRERMEIKQKMLQISRELAISLKTSQDSLFIESSAEYPALWNHKQVDAQHIYFSRDEQARKDLDSFVDRQKPMNTLLDDPTPQRNHVFLAWTLNQDGFEVSLKLHPDATIDRQNFERKMADHFEAEKFLFLLSELPASYHFGIGSRRYQIKQIKQMPDALEFVRNLLKEWSSFSLESTNLMLASGPHPVSLFFIATYLPKQEIVNSPSSSEVIQWVDVNLAKLRALYHFMSWTKANDFVSFKQVLDKEKLNRIQKGLEKGDKIRVIRGMWAGKSGVVQEVDGKGVLRALLGKVAVKVSSGDVEKA